MTYADLIREYARQKGLRRWLISVPVLTPWLSGLWLALVTPASFEVGRHLIEGLKNPTVVRDRTALDVFRPDGTLNNRTWAEEELAACHLPGHPAKKQSVLALTSRETEVAHLIGNGLSNPEIAAELFISRKAVEYHLGNIYAKCGLQGRQQLRRFVDQWGQAAPV